MKDIHHNKTELDQNNLNKQIVQIFKYWDMHTYIKYHMLSHV